MYMYLYVCTACMHEYILYVCIYVCMYACIYYVCMYVCIWTNVGQMLLSKRFVHYNAGVWKGTAKINFYSKREAQQATESL